MDKVCYVCCGALNADKDLHFTCPNDPKLHTLCAGCFADYVKTSCDYYAVEQNFPLRCSMPKCVYLIPDAEIRRILLDPAVVTGAKTWELYQRTQVKAALNQGPKDEIPVTCHICGYTEILVAAPPQYWEQLKRVKNVGKLLAEKASDEFRNAETKKIKDHSKDAADDVHKVLQARIDSITQEFKVWQDAAEAKYQEARKNAQEEKESWVMRETEQYSKSENAYWEVVSELFQLQWGEKLENRAHSNEQVRFLFQDFKMDDSDYELLFDVVPDADDTDSAERKAELKAKKMRQLRVKAEMLNQELRMLAPRIDDAIVIGESQMNEAIKLAEDIKKDMLFQPMENRGEALKFIEMERAERLLHIKQEEEHALEIVNAEAQSMIERRMQLLESDMIRVKLRDKLMMKVTKLDRQKSEEHLKKKAEEEMKKKEKEEKETKKKKKKKVTIKELEAALKKDEKEEEVKIDDPQDIDILELLDEEDFKISDDFSAATSQYFVCQQISCDGAVCVRCQERLMKSTVYTHVCKEDAVQELYTKILEVLAEASSVNCPGCKSIWRKDLACTHMHCDKCGGYFCYHCGKSQAEVGGDFGPHNNWNLSTPEDSGLCPMYLHYKYGDRPGGENRLDGDAQKALDKFHQTKQRKAIEEFRKTVDKDLWEETIKSKFPFGLWDENRPADPPAVAPPSG